MTKWCLTKQTAEDLLSRIKSKEISYAKLKKMESGKRSEYFREFMSPDDAKRVNLLFEKKLLQKDYYRAMESFAAEVSGKEPARAKMLGKMIERRKQQNINKIFNPKDEQSFLKELAEAKLGIGVTAEEAKLVYRLSRVVSKGDEMFDKRLLRRKLSEVKGADITPGDEKALDEFIEKLDSAARDKETDKFFSSAVARKFSRYLEGEKPSTETKERVSALVKDIIDSRNDENYGVSRVLLEDFVGGVKKDAEKNAAKLFSEGRVAGAAGKALTDFAGAMKSAVASIDDSFIGRQGWKTLLSWKFKEWGQMAARNLSDIPKAMKSSGKDDKAFISGVKAAIFNRPNGRSGLYDKMKLAIGVNEEQFPNSLPAKIPYLGRFFKASEELYTATAYQLRADLADSYIDKFKKDYEALGLKLEDDKAALESIGKLVNSLTGRGDIGLGKAGKVINVSLFSPKFIQSQIDTLTAHTFDDAMAAPVKKEARKNLLKQMASVAGVLYAADKLWPGSVEEDPRSSDFGKIRIGNTRFDMTGGAGSFITLLSRFGGTKSSQTGIVKKIGDYGSDDIVGTFSSFFENKASPFAKFIINNANGKNFDGEKMGPKALAENPQDAIWVTAKEFFPISTESFAKAVKEKDPVVTAAFISDFFGMSSNTYLYPTNWKSSTSNDLAQFKEKIGKDEFEEAEKEYAKRLTDKFLGIRSSGEYDSLSDEEKKKVIDAHKNSIKNEIFKEYKFDPKRVTKSNPTVEKLKK